jgi:hypothetical protein
MLNFRYIEEIYRSSYTSKHHYRFPLTVSVLLQPLALWTYDGISKENAIFNVVPYFKVNEDVARGFYF